MAAMCYWCPPPPPPITKHLPTPLVWAGVQDDEKALRATALCQYGGDMDCDKII